AADEVIFCFDGDRAGRQAAWRALENTLPRLKDGRQARFLFLPEGEDPDSMVRQEGAEAFNRRLDAAQPLSDYFFEHFTAEVDMAALDGRARLVAKARPALEVIPDGVFRDMMFERLGTLAQHRLRSRASVTSARGARQTTGRPALQRTPMRVALAHLVQDPSLAGSAAHDHDEALQGCTLKGFEIWLELVDFCSKSPNMTTAQLLELLHDHPARSHLEKLATWQLPGDDEQRAREFRDAVTGLELQWTEARIAEMPKIVDLGPEQKSELLALQNRRQELIGRLQGEE
ncbi:MAG: DNA primase, partial [Gammaproteobacteria bacterium]|nr:DNA primase [Gammaproteobacteria bacterium]